MQADSVYLSNTANVSRLNINVIFAHRLARADLMPQLQKYLKLEQGKGADQWLIAEYVWIDGSNGVRSKCKVRNCSTFHHHHPFSPVVRSGLKPVSPRSDTVAAVSAKIKDAAVPLCLFKQ